MKHFCVPILLAILAVVAILPTWAQTARPMLPTPSSIVQPPTISQRNTAASARLMAPTAATIRYVKAGASGTGTSWSNASGDLQAMINASASGDQVWIAGGTYKPSTTGLTNARTAAFSLKGGVSVVGGFTGASGTEGNNTRTSTPSSTTLSGDIGTMGDNSDNCYHVINNIDQNRPGNALVLAGVVITAGNANGTTNPQDGAGGGFISADNTASLINCIFIQNSASTSGGGMYIQSADGLSLTNCLFVNNSATFGGGFTSGAGTTATLTNCFFEKNAGSQNGGGTDQAGDATGTTTYINCTFRGNTARGGAAIDVAGSTTTRLINCLLWDNEGQNTINSFGTATVTASYCLIQTGAATYTDGGNNQTLSSSPFNNATGPALSACAPAVDAGNDAANATTTDVLGNARKVRTIDIGAAEFQGTPSQRVALINPEQPATPICAGTTENFAVTFTGTGPFAVELFQNNVRIGTFGPFDAPSRFVAGAPISQGGSYQYVVTTACNSVTTTFAPITVNPLPTQFSVTGGGAYCAGFPGVVVGLSGSQTGVNYQLRRDGNPVGSPTAGTGGVLNFGTQTTAGTYTVLATNASTSCQQAMSGSASVTVNPLPTVYTVSGGGAFCAGGTGVSVNLSGSQTGVNYQLLRDNTPVGSPVAGTGIGLSFGNQTTGGGYSVRATNITTNCQQLMSGSASVTVNPLPTQFSVTGGGAYCAGGSGQPVGLSGSQIGINYQLLRDNTPVDSPLAGTGAAITFGSQTTAGTYTVQATNPTTACQQTMTGSAVIVVNPLPTAYTVTGGGSFCAGGSGIPVGLSGSQTGINYQLLRDGNPVDIAVAGTGNPLSFGNQTTGGTYTVRATNPTTACQQLMNGSTTVTVNPLPIAYTVTGGGAYCVGSNGIAVGLSGSQTGINYRLLRDGNSVVSSLVGTGNPISFGNQTQAGTYSVQAIDPATICQQTMSGSATVSITPLPDAPSLLTQSGYAYPAGVSSLTLSQNVGPVSLTVLGCSGGMLMANGDAASSFTISTASTGTQTYTATCTQGGCTSPAGSFQLTVVSTTLSVLHRDADYGNTQNNIIKPYLQLANSGGQAIPYGDITVRYWFTSEGNSLPTNLAVYYAQLGAVNMKYLALAQPRQGAFGYVEYSFPGGRSLSAGANSGPIENGIQKPDGSPFNESDDYSYAANYQTYLPNMRITAYRNGVIVYGQEPTMVTSQTAVAVFSAAKDSPTTSQIQTRLELRNQGNVALPVSGLKLRYYFTSDNNQPANVFVDYADMGAARVAARVVKLPVPVEGADSYVELSFPGNPMQVNALSSLGVVDFRLVRSDNGLFNQTNDYSYAANYGSVGLNNRVTVLLDNRLIFGTPPSGAPARLGASEPVAPLSVQVLGNPVVGSQAQIEIRGAEGQPVSLQLVDLQGRLVHEQRIEQAAEVESVNVPLGQSRGILLLKVSTTGQQQSLRLVRP